MVATSRFYHVHQLSPSTYDPNELQSWDNQLRNQLGQEQHNTEQNLMTLDRVLSGLIDTKRDALFAICGELLNARFSLMRVDPANDLSSRYVDMDGRSLAVGSTGTRLLMTLLGICLDDRFESLLIDEPELGLSPKVQHAFSNLLQDREPRLRYFPHLKRVFLATHSHIFLPRGEGGMQNSFVVEKEGRQVSLSQVGSISDFHKLQFNLLGNSLETMFLPAAVVVVEGKTDHTFLERVIAQRFPSKRITVIQANSDSQIKEKVYLLNAAFGDLDSSPMRNRLFVVLDETHQNGLPGVLEKMGVNPGNIVIWNGNGIEYVYPSSLVARAFSCSSDMVEQMDIKDDRIELNKMTKTKNELVEAVVSWLDPSTVLPSELDDKLLVPLATAVG